MKPLSAFEVGVVRFDETVDVASAPSPTRSESSRLLVRQQMATTTRQYRRWRFHISKKRARLGENADAALTWSLAIKHKDNGHRLE